MEDVPRTTSVSSNIRKIVTKQVLVYLMSLKREVLKGVMKEEEAIVMKSTNPVINIKKREVAKVVMNTNLVLMKEGEAKVVKNTNLVMMKEEVEKEVMKRKGVQVKGASLSSMVNSLLLRTLCHQVYFNIRLYSLRIFHVHLVKGLQTIGITQLILLFYGKAPLSWILAS